MTTYTVARWRLCEVSWVLVWRMFFSTSQGPTRTRCALLELNSRGEFTQTTDVIKDDTPYAILSHTWGADNDEVTF